MINLILCGGSGTRLWPFSRSNLPKQFLKLIENRSLFQLTLERNSKICNSFIIVSGAKYYSLVLNQIKELRAFEALSIRYILEPFGRNTAPAVAIACMLLNKEEIVLVTPSDHLIRKEDEYKKAVQRAKELARKGFLVTFGIKPTRPETGFGYLEAYGEYVKRFHEKPDLKTAENYLSTLCPVL